MQLITSTEERLRRLAATGTDYCILLDFTPQMAQMSAHDFIAFLHDNYNIRHLVVGYDHRFGHNINETYDDYCRYGKELGVTISRSGACMPEGHKVSSSIIRRLLGEGRVHDAALLLSYDYEIEGHVVAGHQLGRRIGFPTANISCDFPEKSFRQTVYMPSVYISKTISNAAAC